MLTDLTMEDPISIDDTILYKYFSEEIPPEEEKAILEWLERSEENRRYFFDLKAVWNARKVFSEGTDLAGFAGFLRSTNARIDSLEAVVPKPRKSLSGWVLAAAASVALILMAGGGWMIFSSPKAFHVYENSTDNVATIQLSDGTQVWLNAHTTLTLPEAFSDSERMVELTGAAFFDVTPNAQAPFTVRTQVLQIQVLGTSFCVHAEKDSNRSEVVLERGSVRLCTPDGVNLVKLHPDQCATYDATDNNLEISEVNASHFVLSKYDLVTMNNVTLHEIISRLETTYGVRLSIPNRYGDKRYAFNFQHSNSLDQVLHIVEYMTGEKCEIIVNGARK